MEETYKGFLSLTPWQRNPPSSLSLIHVLYPSECKHNLRSKQGWLPWIKGHINDLVDLLFIFFYLWQNMWLSPQLLSIRSTMWLRLCIVPYISSGNLANMIYVFWKINHHIKFFLIIRNFSLIKNSQRYLLVHIFIKYIDPSLEQSNQTPANA